MNRLDVPNPTSSLCSLALLAVIAGLVVSPSVAQEDASAPQQDRIGIPIEVPLPLTSSKVAGVKQTLRALLDITPTVTEKPPVFVMQFETSRGATGAGSEFHACAELADFLASPELARIKVVAYVPPLRGRVPVNQEGPTTQLVGHAVLVALACEEIVLHQSAGMGKAGIDVKDLTPPILSTYQFIAGKRSPLPEPITMSLLDRSRTLFEVTTRNGDRYLAQAEAEKLVREGKASAMNSLSGPGDLPMFAAQQLESFSTNCHTVETRAELEAIYDLAPSSLEGNPARGSSIQPILVELPGYIDQRTVDWSIRALNARMGKDTNMIILKIDAKGGDLLSCLQMARFLADFDPQKVLTVAYVEEKAKGPAALIALACDHLVMQTDSRLGGAYKPKISEEELETILPAIEDLAKDKEKKWSLFLSVLDFETELQRWKNGQREQLFSKTEHEGMSDAEAWTWQDTQPMHEGLTADTAWQRGIAKNLVLDMQRLENYYNIENPETLTPTKTDKMIESLAQFLAGPMISSLLLFGAMFLISTEMSNPGISIPGFLGTLCLILFFWSQYLDGNAHWLEILLFIAGAIFILMEIFVLPGLGVFGIGGLLMVVCSIVLASQTFIIPSNSEEFARLPVSLGMVAAASSGFLVALAVLRKVLPNTPYFQKMMLAPPTRDPELRDREAIVDWSEMLGKTGVAITPLIPAGKARIAGKLLDVITDGRVVEKGQSIIVQEAVGNRIVVAPSKSD